MGDMERRPFAAQARAANARPYHGRLALVVKFRRRPAASSPETGPVTFTIRPSMRCGIAVVKLPLSVSTIMAAFVAQERAAGT
ncbi:hypothetical protein GCM10010124_14120 [Pilimelia terevasa]|uniref:Uncharacterized protein n=1 Tax=Pilimelia terevasa TaxID=53372 RepID=A0A8J3FFY2_9ACTN|nr:hypothetical protein GCM10010124_14120 [Pilimelia terevasa]